MEFIYLLLGVSFIFLATTLGSSFIFLLRKTENKSVQAIFLGFAGGIMLAASFFSLLLPSLDKGNIYKTLIGFVIGALLIEIIEMVIRKKNHPKNRWYNAYFAVTIHNIPEGLAVGVGFGAYLVTNNPEMLLMAFSVAIGIGIQNIPEGFATVLPIYTETKSKKKSFLLGVISGLVEPIAALIGALLISIISPLLPYALSFAAGAMIYVIVDEIIPSFDSKKERNSLYAFVMGFCLMMYLDVLLG